MAHGVKHDLLWYKPNEVPWRYTCTCQSLQDYYRAKIKQSDNLSKLVRCRSEKSCYTEYRVDFSKVDLDFTRALTETRADKEGKCLFCHSYAFAQRTENVIITKFPE